MKRTVWMMAAVGIVLLGFAACGSAAPESPDENTLFAANGPALTVVESSPTNIPPTRRTKQFRRSSPPTC